MKQIGQLAGVSQSTVTRVLSGAASIVPVAEDTRARILQVVAESGYSPNPLARALRGARTGLLGLIVRDIGDPFFGMAIAAITGIARDTGYNVVLGHVRSSAAEAIALRGVLEMGHCDGAILLGDLRDQTRLLADLVGHPTPLVGIWQGARARTIPVVNVDNRAGVALAVQHLQGLGHQRIAFLQGGRTGDAIERRDAFIAAMRAGGMAVADEYVQVSDNAFGEAALAMERLLSLARRPTAVLASTDVAAIGALKAASRARLRVPDDLSLVGFDDIPLAEFVIPSLTTVHQPIDQIAQASLQQVFEADERRPAKDASADPAALSRRTRFHCPTAQGACMSTPPSSGPYAVGVDFGTESGRAVLVDVRTGAELASAVYPYANGVIDSTLPSNGARLPPEWALQDPADYIRTLTTTIPDVLEQTGVAAEDVIGLGIDFTACTMLPVDAAGQALCFDPRFAGHPHAWVKLWKHHAAQPEADKVNAVAVARAEAFLARYGGKISSEWLIPKILQILDDAPEVYDAAARFMEAADWVILQLTGRERRNACTAGYKAIWDKDSGYPDPEYFAALHPGLRNVVADKLSTDIYPQGERAGGLTSEMAARVGLRPGTAVAVANVDAHVAVPACTVVEPARMVMVMGTSICHMVLGTDKQMVPGMCGVVEDGILPGFFGYEAGQSAAGDIFGWFVDTCVPPEYRAEARERGLDVHRLLEEKAARLRPGESGLLALDWWNGNRSVLVDVDLSGLLLGMTLQTRPEEIYRALIEATAFGTHTIIRNFADNGVPVDELYACGGLAERNALLMQIYADVTGMEIKLSASSQTPALGSAMFGALAAGSANGGYDDIIAAARQMARLKPKVFRADPAAHAVYQRLYAEYLRLHDYFGRGQNNVMKALKSIRDAAIGEQPHLDALVGLEAEAADVSLSGERRP